MSHVIDFIYRLSSQFRDGTGSHSLYVLAAVLAVYIFIVFGRTRAGR